ncbi:MAG: FAD-dependent oxidoreductase [Candidatus Binatia bacterium]|nr:FAD-dependent oxidoreductase [Candidatus Binatia bacterium]
MERLYECAVVGIEEAAPGVRRMAVERPPGLKWLPGQDLAVELPGSTGRTAWYAIAIAPEVAGPLEIFVDVTRRGVGPSYMGQLAVGQTLRFRAPVGDFFLDRAPGAPLVLAGVGLGIVALRPMVQRLLRHRLAFPLRVHHFIQDLTQQLFRPELVREVFRHEQFEYELLFDLPVVDYLYGRYVGGTVERNWIFYLCGPGPDVRNAGELLIDAGYPQGAIHLQQW